MVKSPEVKRIIENHQILRQKEDLSRTSCHEDERLRPRQRG